MNNLSQAAALPSGVRLIFITEITCCRVAQEDDESINGINIVE